ncbi:hypothetical protein [Alkalicoccus saliphilus]|uniref:Uncharacterized protein n=1 Tax=Alkalicoccus saliphilus TaxID=200989 RepID=A0A2T4U3C2_9BACI|nr:hypothetical protein [Alkalicoccus saliphilus]PTL37869.1 hypothetical protein C6Y45_14090 [Alkalicoccus saliphilus]
MKLAEGTAEFFSRPVDGMINGRGVMINRPVIKFNLLPVMTTKPLILINPSRNTASSVPSKPQTGC